MVGFIDDSPYLAGRIVRGLSNKEIARDLDLSPATIKAHTSAAIAVLGAVNRAEAVFKARELGLI